MKKMGTEIQRLSYEIRVSRLWLGEVGVRVGKELRFDETTSAPYLPCSVELGNDVVYFHFPLNRLGRRFIREIRTHLLKGIVCGTIKEEDAKALFITLSVPKVIAKYRDRIRHVTGLVKDERLRRWMIWRRLRCTQMVKSLKRG